LLALFSFNSVGFVTSGAESNWQTGSGYRWSELPVPKSGKTGFTLLPPESTGIFFTNHLSDVNAAKNRIGRAGD